MGQRHNFAFTDLALPYLLTFNVRLQKHWYAFSISFSFVSYHISHIKTCDLSRSNCSFVSMIEFKTMMIVFKGLHGKAPSYYVQGIITPSKSRYSMRSNEACARKVQKIQAQYFRQACIRSMWSSAMELLSKGNKVMR